MAGIERVKKESVIIWLEGITEFCLCTLIFSLPFSKSMVEVSFASAFVCWFVKRQLEYGLRFKLYGLRNAPFRRKISALIEAFKPVRTELNLPIGIFTFVCFLSVVTSVSLPLSLEGFFFKLFEWIMIYFIVAETIDSKKKLNRILWVIIVSMAFISLDGIFQFVTGTDFIRNYSTGHRIQASFSNPNSFAGWLVAMLPIALSLAYFGINNKFDPSGRYNRIKRALKPALWIITGLLMICLSETYTRGAWVAAISALIFLGILRSKKLLAIIIIALLILPFIATDAMKERASLLARIPETSIYRFKLWQEASEIIEDFPLLGSGLNTYASVGPIYMVTKATGFYPHNSYLHMAAESGLLGLGTFVWIMITLFRASLAGFKRMQNIFNSSVLIGLLAGLFGFLIHSFFDTNIYTLQLGNFMWFIMGLIVAVQKVAPAGGRSTSPQ